MVQVGLVFVSLFSCSLGVGQRGALKPRGARSVALFTKLFDITQRNYMILARELPSYTMKIFIPKNAAYLEQDSNKMETAEALPDVLMAAKNEGRLVCGVYESGQLLEENPEEVMLCVLPSVEEKDITLHIHFTLIEAFCWENSISLLKVDSATKLAKLLGESGTTTSSLMANDNYIATNRAARTDFNCVLVRYPVEGSSEAEEDVMEYCKNTCDWAQVPVIELPV